MMRFETSLSVIGGAGLRSGLVRFTLDAAADRTKTVMETELKPGLAFKPLWFIATPFPRRMWRASFPNLNQLIEAGG